jgi:hypothetical protein
MSILSCGASGFTEPGDCALAMPQQRLDAIKMLLKLPGLMDRIVLVG